MKNKWKSNRGLKAAMAIASLLMAAATVCSTAAVCLCGTLGVYVRPKEEVLKEHYDQYSGIYSVMALAGLNDEDIAEELSRTNFRYGIIKADDINTIDISDPASYQAYNFETMPGKDALADDEVRAVQFLTGPGTMLHWDNRLFGYSYTYETQEQYSAVANHIPSTKRVHVASGHISIQCQVSDMKGGKR